MDTSWSAAVLVGGRARRLEGRAKPLLDVDGQPILTRLAAALAGLDRVPTLVTPDPAPYAATGFFIQQDLVDGGSLGALYTALATASTAYVLVLAGDLPFVTTAFLAHLVDCRRGWDAVVPRTAGRWHPLCAVYAAHAAPRLRARIDRGALRITDALADLSVRAVDDAEIRPFDADGRLLLNVNTPDDLRRAVAPGPHRH
jgi:molybdopterin-guanine dinucleotide biosynthesis protein A